MDGHSSHFNPTTVRRADEENIILFCLPPHTTHLTQPLDKSVFGVLKKYWREKCHDYITRNPGRVVSKYQFSTLFSASWYRAMTVRNIVAGFKITGVYPFNPNAIVIQDGSHESASVAESTLIAYIPLFSPPKRNRNKEIRSPESSRSLTASPTSPQSHPSAACTPASSPSTSHLVCGLHEDTVYALPKKSTLSKFLTYPHPPSKEIHLRGYSQQKS